MWWARIFSHHEMVDTMPPPTVVAPDFGSAAFWDETTTQESHYGQEWIAEYTDLAPLLQRCCDPSTSILHAGCGISGLSQSMHDDPRMRCYHQVAIDFSQQCIRRQNILCGESRPGLTNLVMDCTRLGFRNATMDVVLDKSTVDAMLCADDGEEAVSSMIQEVHRVLRPGGLWIVVSLSAPEVIAPILTGAPRGTSATLLACRCVTGRMSTTYVYIAKILCGDDATHLMASTDAADRAQRGWIRAVHETTRWLPAISLQECLSLADGSSAGPEIWSRGISEPDIGSLQAMLMRHQLIPAIDEGVTPVALHLQGSNLAILPDVFSRLSLLRTIDCRRNQLVTLPSSFCCALALETLLLDHNSLQELPAALGALVRLRTLSATHNRLSELPSSWKQLTATLECLRLQHNPLSDVQLAELRDCTVARIDERQRARQALPLAIARAS